MTGHRVERAAMLHDWVDLAMTHFAIDPRKLQPAVPLPLDTFRGAAYITLVPFRLTNIRCPLLPKVTRALLRPVSEHRLLNVRTYVRHPDGDTGIYFLREFTDHRLNSVLAPLLYGTPYRHVTFHDHGITSADGTLDIDVAPYLNITSAALGTLDHFLLERYTAWCGARGTMMRFDIEHAPWRFRHAAARYINTSLLTRLFPWFKHAEPVARGGAHACLPLRGVRVSFPQKARGWQSPGVDFDTPSFPRSPHHDELHPADLRALHPH